MNSVSKRSYRKNLITNSLIFINGEEREVSVSNLSMTGMLVQLNGASGAEIASNGLLLLSTIIDFYLPKLRLAGTAEIVRITKAESQVLLALKFKEISYNVDNLLYKRKVYRKSMSVAGKILFKNKNYNFHTVNVSVEGLMIRLTETAVITEGIIAPFEFKDFSLKGEGIVVWVDSDTEGKTLVGLKYINMNTDVIKGIPRFSTENT